MTSVKSESDGMRLVEEIKRAINEIYSRKDKVYLSIAEQKIKIEVLDVYKSLPKTNCAQCGEVT